MLPRLSAPVSGVDCPCRGSTPTLFAVPLPTPLSSFVQPTLIRVPLPLPDTARFQVQKSFVWFRAETDKGIVCLGHPYSATPRHNQHSRQLSPWHFHHKTKTTHSLPTHVTLLYQAFQEQLIPTHLMSSSNNAYYFSTRKITTPWRRNTYTHSADLEWNMP